MADPARYEELRPKARAIRDIAAQNATGAQ